MRQHSKITSCSRKRLRVPFAFTVSSPGTRNRLQPIVCTALAAVAAVAFLAATGCRKAQSDSTSTEASKPALVEVAKVIQKQVKPKIELVGTVTAIRRATIGSPVSERVESVNVDIGDEVHADSGPSSDAEKATQPMVTLNTEVIDLQIAAAEAELSRLQQVLQQLRAGNRPEEIARAKAQLEAAKAANQLAAAKLNRAQQLSQLNSISEDELETAQAAATEARHRLAAAEADYAIMLDGPRKEEIAQAEAEVTKQQSEVARLNVERERHAIRAPFDAFVFQKLVDVGEWLTVGDPVIELVALNPIGVRIHVPEHLVHQLRVGDEVTLHVDALPAEYRDQIGVIRGIAPSADAQARTFAVRIRVDNPRHDGRYLLRDGMQANAEVNGAPREALMIPKDAVVLSDATRYVMVVRKLENGKTVAARVEVRTGTGHGELIEVEGDLSDGDLVIVRGNERLQPGQPVRFVNANS